MADLNFRRLHELFREREQLTRKWREAGRESESLVLEHNKLVRDADQAVTSGARQRARANAGRKGEELQKARVRTERLSDEVQRKEVEIADIIAALAAAAEPFLSASQLQKLTELNGRLQRVEQGVTSATVTLAGLKAVIQQQASLSKSAANQQGAHNDAAVSAADSAASALTRILHELEEQSRSLYGISGTLAGQGTRRSLPPATEVVQVGWDGTPVAAGPDPAEAAPDEVAALPRKVTVLIFASEPRDQPRLDLDREINEIHSKINDARFSDHIVLVSWLAAEPLDLIPNVNRHKPHMVQFSGHGTPDGILLMGPPTRSQPLAADRLIQMLRWSGENLRIVFFNICDSEEHARAAAQIVDGAIGMRGEMHDGPARTFAAFLYSGLAFGKPLKQAFHQACAQIGDEPDSVIPQLFFRDGVDPRKVILVRPGGDRPA
jgi:hypothetical protein